MGRHFIPNRSVKVIDVASVMQCGTVCVRIRACEYSWAKLLESSVIGAGESQRPQWKFRKFGWFEAQADNFSFVLVQVSKEVCWHSRVYCNSIGVRGQLSVPILVWYVCSYSILWGKNKLWLYDESGKSTLIPVLAVLEACEELYKDKVTYQPLSLFVSGSFSFLSFLVQHTDTHHYLTNLAQ